MADAESGSRRDLLPTAGERELVTALAQEALEQAAPEELPLFSDVASEYFRDPEAALEVRQREESVGFGLELALLTPYVLAVVTYVVRMLASLIEQSVRDELKPSVEQLVHKMFRRHGQAPAEAEAGAETPILTTDQLLRVRESAYGRGIALGLDETRAGLLADAVVGRLAATP